jgi:hypothetical protein
MARASQFLIVCGLLFLGVSFAQTPNNARMVSTPNSQTGTSYAFVPADATRVTVFNNANPVAATLANGATVGFGAGTLFSVANLGAGVVTITCTSCTINGAGTLALSQNQGADIYGGYGSPAVNYVALPSPSGSGPLSASSLTVSGQITSTVATGTAPLVISSTTAIPNLNAQLHNGLTAPGSASLGLTDTQSPTNKTIDISLNTVKNSTNTAGHYQRNNGTQYVDSAIQSADLPFGVQVSAATNFGVNLSAQTVVASVPVTGIVVVFTRPVVSQIGASCSAGTNNVSAVTLSWTAPGGTVETLAGGTPISFTGNGVLDNDSGVTTSNDGQSFNIVAKAGTAITYTTTSSLGSTGCFRCRNTPYTPKRFSNQSSV